MTKSFSFAYMLSIYVLTDGSFLLRQVFLPLSRFGQQVFKLGIPWFLKWEWSLTVILMVYFTKQLPCVECTKSIETHIIVILSNHFLCLESRRVLTKFNYGGKLQKTKSRTPTPQKWSCDSIDYWVLWNTHILDNICDYIYDTGSWLWYIAFLLGDYFP